MFFQRLNQFNLRFKWPMLIVWLLMAGVVLWRAPVLSQVAKTDQVSFLPAQSETMQMARLTRELYPAQGNGSSLLLVLQRKGGLDDADRAYAVEVEHYLKHQRALYRIRGIKSPFTSDELAKAMISQDREAALIEVDLSTSGFQEVTNQAVRSLRSDLQNGGGAPGKPRGLTLHVTGDAALGEEQVDSINHSMALTEKITILLVVVILILIYRSPVAPILPLTTIGLSFLISRGVIAALTTFGWKVSSFTETFLVAVLFGAGTDYCLLLISRYREEILAGNKPVAALAAAFPHTGAAILSSGGTVMIGFFCMISATFGLFSTTGPSIAIGVGVTLLAVLTLTPALIAIWGERIFWPSRPSGDRGKKENLFWHHLAELVTSQPGRIILVSLVVITPFIYFCFHIDRTFDWLGELPAGSDTVKGFGLIKEHFDQGEMLPVKVVLKARRDLWRGDSLQAIDSVAKNIARVDGVAKVRTATRPLGEQINQTTLPSQLRQLYHGLNRIETGFDPLIGGLNQARSGVSTVAQGMAAGGRGWGTLAAKTEEAAHGVTQVTEGIDQLDGGTAAAINGLGQVSGSLQGAVSGISESKRTVDLGYRALQVATSLLDEAEKEQPGLAGNPQYKGARGILQQLMANFPAVGNGLQQVQEGVAGARAGTDQVSGGLQNVREGIEQSRTALRQVLAGLDAVTANQSQAGTELTLAAASLDRIASGLQPGLDGLNSLKGGVEDLQGATSNYLTGSGQLKDIFYLPPGALQQYPQLRQAMEYYISPDGRGVTFEVILSPPPYSGQALDSIAKIKEAVGFSLKGTPLAGSEFYTGGSTAANSELKEITAADFVKVIVFVLLGIFIVLALLLRSLTAPIYLIITILLSFATTMGISYLVFQVGLGKEGLTWSVPFFSFCILVALGVDYNIFLMTRVKEEYRPGDMTSGTARALAGTGRIITSCGIIMAGTFGALMVSPVAQLVEIGLATVVGLLLDTFFIRCLLVPAIAVKVGELNWWPGKRVCITAISSS